MTRPPQPGPAPRADHRDAPFSLVDLIQALCAGLTPSSEGLSLVLDRIEAAR